MTVSKEEIRHFEVLYEEEEEDERNWPEEEQNSLRESLEVVVSVDLSVILHRYLSKRLTNRES